MDRARLLALHHPAHRALYRLFDGASAGATVQEAGGLLICTVPARPERALVNCVLYDDPDRLVAALPSLAEHYAAAGIGAWMVWAPPGEDRVAAACAAAGHRLDGTPELMWAALDDAFALDTGEVVIDEQPSWRTIGDLNDEAYGLPPDHLAAVVAGVGPGHPNVWRAAAVAGDDGAVACAIVVTAGGAAEVALVATRPDWRGRGLATACMRSCLARAKAEGGATHTVLEASALGVPVYERMGYTVAGPTQMWELRRPPA